jgi:hypothetical protein
MSVKEKLLEHLFPELPNIHLSRGIKSVLEREQWT